jgi:hypothetical protein
LIYLGLHIDLPRRIIQATPQCIQHLLQLLSIVPKASHQDLARITGYATWLAWALNWPTFVATLLRQTETYWMRWLHHYELLEHPRRLQSPLRSVHLYTDTTPTSIGILWPGPPQRQLHRAYQDYKPIAFAEMAAALLGLLYTAQDCAQPTTIALLTNSAVVYYTLSSGKGLTFRSNVLLQELYVTYFKIKSDRGHRLVVRWIPSGANLAVSHWRPAAVERKVTRHD